MRHFTLLFCWILSWDFRMAFLRSGGLGDEIIFSQNIYMYSMCTNRYIILVSLFFMPWCFSTAVWITYFIYILTQSIFSHPRYFHVLHGSSNTVNKTNARGSHVGNSRPRYQKGTFAVIIVFSLFCWTKEKKITIQNREIS